MDAASSHVHAGIYAAVTGQQVFVNVLCRHEVDGLAIRSRMAREETRPYGPFDEIAFTVDFLVVEEGDTLLYK
jgi:hypothetical protein